MTKLVVTAHAGGGHTAVAKYEEAVSEEEVFVIDFYDWIPEFLGKDLLKKWEGARAEGSFEASEKLDKLQWLAELFYAPFFFFGLYQYLKREEIEQVVSVQPMGLKAMCKAVRFYNWQTGSDVGFTLFFTDLPTPSCLHYLNPLRSLKKKDKKHLVLKVPSIWKEDSEGIKAFRRLCPYPKKGIKLLPVTAFPVLSAHKSPRLKDYLPQKACTLAVTYSEEEKELARQIPNLSPFLTAGDRIELNLSAQDHSHALLMGSVPSENVVEAFVKAATKLSPDEAERHFVFIGTGKKEVSLSLFKKICSLLEHQEVAPNVYIFPIPYLPIEDLSAICVRSHLFLRPSGISVMEAWARNWICDGMEGAVTVLDLGVELKKGGIRVVPVWEGGNGEVLAKRLEGAHVRVDEIENTLLGKLS